MTTYRVSLELTDNLWRIAIGDTNVGFAEVVEVDRGRCVLVSQKRPLGGVLEIRADGVTIENGVAKFIQSQE